MNMPSLAFDVHGPDDAPMLVLSSSLGSTRDLWLPQLEALSRRWRVVRFDHPGHGASPVWKDKVTVAGIGQAVLELLDELGGKRASFCGISLGGAVGQWLAAHAAGRIDRLILCCTAPSFAAEVYRQRAAVVRAQGVGAVAAAVIERWFTPEFRAEQPDVVAGYRATLEATAPEGYAACCEAVAAFDGRADLTAITAPTLVIAGAEDQAIPIDQARVLSGEIAGAQLRIIPRAAHLANVEQPAAVEAAILEHLGEGRHG
jgi:3-oxoadipate enol-lactonase